MGDGVHPVEFKGNPLAVEDLVPGHIELTQSVFRIGTLVADGDAYYVETVTPEGFPGFLDEGHLGLAGAAPGGPVVQQDVFAFAHVVRKPDIGTVRIAAGNEVVRERLSFLRSLLDHNGFIGRSDQVKLLIPGRYLPVEIQKTLLVHIGKVLERQGAHQVVPVGEDYGIGQGRLGFLLIPAVPVKTPVESRVGIFQRGAGGDALVDIDSNLPRLQDQAHPLFPIAHIGVERLPGLALEGEPAPLHRRLRQGVLGIQVDEPDRCAVIGNPEAVDLILMLLAGGEGQCHCYKAGEP